MPERQAAEKDQVIRLHQTQMLLKLLLKFQSYHQRISYWRRLSQAHQERTYHSAGCLCAVPLHSDVRLLQRRQVKMLHHSNRLPQYSYEVCISDYPEYGICYTLCSPRLFQNISESE